MREFTNIIINKMADRSCLEMGGSGCQLETQFVCAEEYIAHPNFKKNICVTTAVMNVLILALTALHGSSSMRKAV